MRLRRGVLVVQQVPAVSTSIKAERQLRLPEFAGVFVLELHQVSTSIKAERQLRLVPLGHGDDRRRSDEYQPASKPKGN